MNKISPDELKSTLKMHKLWIESEGQTGRRAILSYKDHRDHDFYGVNLVSAELRGCDLRGVNLTCANLRGVDLVGSDLRGAKLDFGIVTVFRIRNIKFSPDALPWLMLRPSWRDEIESVSICDEI